MGYGDVVITDFHGNTHTLRDIWYIPGLDDSILSKNWTKQSGLRTVMDEFEDFHFYSIDPNDPFLISTTQDDKISVINGLKVVEYNPTAPTAASASSPSLFPKPWLPLQPMSHRISCINASDIHPPNECEFSDIHSLPANAMTASWANKPESRSRQT